MKKEGRSESESGGEDFDFFDLDPHRLDEEWVHQPKLYFEWATKLADAKKDLELTRATLDQVVARLDRLIRQEPLAFDLPKVTEGVVEKTILLQDAYQAAHREVLRAKDRVNKVEAVVAALDHRKKALENLVYLHGQSYFSTPTAPRGMKDRMDEVEKASVRGRARRALNQ
jgi:hypothetical protein